jgi:ABC-type taurine transport system substrate-binding protein
MSSSEVSEVDDPVRAALDAVTDVAEKTAQGSLELAEESRRASDDRAQGATVSAAMASGQLQRLFRGSEGMAKALLGTTAALRKVVVRELSAEGERVGHISRLFGVSHQRITTLLRGKDRDGQT